MTLTEMWRWGDGDVYVWSVRGTGLSCDGVILWTGLSCGLGYPTGGWYNQSDWEDWIVRRRVEEVGDGDNLGYTCNLLEHE